MLVVQFGSIHARVNIMYNRSKSKTSTHTCVSRGAPKVPQPLVPRSSALPGTARALSTTYLLPAYRDPESVLMVDQSFCTPLNTGDVLLREAGRKLANRHFSSGASTLFSKNYSNALRGMCQHKGGSSLLVNSYASAAVITEDRIKELEEEVHLLKEKNGKLEAENNKLKLGEAVEKARIEARRFLGFQIIQATFGPGGEQPPKKPHQWVLWFWDLPARTKEFASRQKDNLTGWAVAAIVIVALPYLTLEEVRAAVGQLIRGQQQVVIDWVGELVIKMPFLAKILPLPLPSPAHPKCPCGSALPFCASCGRRLSSPTYPKCACGSTLPFCASCGRRLPSLGGPPVSGDTASDK